VSLCLPCGLTVEQVIAGLNDIAQMGLPMLGPEGALVAKAMSVLTVDAENLLAQPTAQQVLTTEVDAEQQAGDAAEDAAFPKP